MATWTAVAAIVSFHILGAGREDAAQMLLEGETGFFRHTGGIGIDGPEKILDFLLNFAFVFCDTDVHLRTNRWANFPRLDLLVHLRLHPYHPKQT